MRYSKNGLLCPNYVKLSDEADKVWGEFYDQHNLAYDAIDDANDDELGACWSKLDFVNGRMTVHSSKTEHYAGGEKRVIPIFPEVRAYLEESFDPQNVYVVNRYRDAKQNLRTTFMKIIQRAGLEPWSKLFHNMRASAQTDLTNRFPVHVVCQWLGNSEIVAKEHYLQVTEEHFQSACSPSKKSWSTSVGNGKKW